MKKKEREREAQLSVCLFLFYFLEIIQKRDKEEGDEFSMWESMGGGGGWNWGNYQKCTIFIILSQYLFKT